MGEKQKLCVTGASGFLASWLVKLLLSKGYIVHGTVRDLQNGDYSHLHNLDKASDNLKLFNAELLDYDALFAAIKGCTGVFHVASPVPSTLVPNPQKELIEPAVNGTLNVLKACYESNVKRVVIVSSIAAVYLTPNWPMDKVKDETCWSDEEYCLKTNTLHSWYGLAKTVAEKEGFKYAKKSGLDVISNCPSLVWGPILEQIPKSSSLSLINLLKEGYETFENKRLPIVDVRDVAESLLLLYEKGEAECRYICTAHDINTLNLVEMLKTTYPNLNYPKSFSACKTEEKLSSERLQKLGWTYRPLEETLKDAIQSYKQAGLLDFSIQYSNN